MNLFKQTRSLFGGTDVWKTNEWLLGLLSLVTSCIAVSIVPFIRKDLGERYFGWLNLYFGYCTIASFTFFGGLLGMFIRSLAPSRLMGFMLVAFIVMSLYRRYEISLKNRAGIEWHSMSIGTSILPFPVSQEKIFKLYEPLTVFTAGYILRNFSGQVGFWLMTGAFCLLINNHIVFHKERQTILDVRDGSIEAKYLSGALAQKPAAETAGFVVGESSAKLIGGDARLITAFDKLSDDLKSILDAPPDLSSESAEEEVTDHDSRR